MENGVNIEVFKGLVSTAPQILQQNTDSVSKAETVGNQLLAEVNELKSSENGTPNFEARKALDAKLNNYLTRVSETIKALNERRKPITGIFDDFKKMFTSLEAKIDPKTVTTFPGQIQSIRNQWAADEAKERQRVAAEQERIRNIESEKINIRANIEKQVLSQFITFAEREQQEFIKSFESLSLVAFDFEAEKLKNYKPEYPAVHFESIKPVVNYAYIDDITYKTIVDEVKNALFAKCCEDFKNTMTATKMMYVEQLESKRTELQEIANANEADRLRLEKEAEQRKADDAARIANEAAQKQQEIVAQVETKQQIAGANLLFEMEAAQIQPSANIKEGIEIVVKNANGWLQIVAFYFEKEGLKKLPDDLGKMKLEQMKTWCEKHTFKTGEKIQSIALEYKDVYKAVNKK